VVADFQVQVGRFVFNRVTQKVVNAKSHVQTPRRDAIPL